MLFRSIIYSVNQNSWDIVNDWANEIESALHENSPDPKKLQNLLGESSALTGVFWVTPDGNSLDLVSQELNRSGSQRSLKETIRDTLQNRSQIVQQLISMKRSGSSLPTRLLLHSLTRERRSFLVSPSPKRCPSRRLIERIGAPRASESG